MLFQVKHFVQALLTNNSINVCLYVLYICLFITWVPVSMKYLPAHGLGIHIEWLRQRHLLKLSTEIFLKKIIINSKGYLSNKKTKFTEAFLWRLLKIRDIYCESGFKKMIGILKGKTSYFLLIVSLERSCGVGIGRQVKFNLS